MPRARTACRAILVVAFGALAFVPARAPLHAQQPIATQPRPQLQPIAPAGEPPAAPASGIDAGEPGITPASPATGSQPIGQTTGPIVHELSPWSMFMNADMLVKGVMVGLALASVITWTIFLAKSIELLAARGGLSGALKRIAGAGTLAEAESALDGRRGVLARLLAAAGDEARISHGSPEGIKERAASRCSEIVKAEGRTARRGMGALATIGAISPFVGLFGTVWGIMNSFIGISKAQTTNLAVVAPGIAEALLATAIGLVAAIPAVIIYNHFARATRGYGDLVQRASGATMRLLSRDLDCPGEAGRHVFLARAAE